MKDILDIERVENIILVQRIKSDMLVMMITKRWKCLINLHNFVFALSLITWFIYLFDNALMGEGFIFLTRGYGFMGGVPTPF